MEKTRQLELAAEVMDEYKKTVLEYVQKMPESYDGFEIREAVRELLPVFAWTKMSIARKKQFRRWFMTNHI
jgi:hypothetical protein